MFELCIGKTKIPYTIRHSDKAMRKRIIVTPHAVEVIAPKFSQDQDIDAFIHKKRRWVYDKREEMQERLAVYEADAYERLRSGAKIPFRGRKLTLRIHRRDEGAVKIEFRNGFHVYIPRHLDDDAAEWQTGFALSCWLKDRLKEDARSLAFLYSQRLGLNYLHVKIRSLPKMWGCCSKGGSITINWHLIAAPKPVLEYVILHEICHRRYRNHSPAFWNLLASHMPDYPARKKWLEISNPYYKL